MPDRTRIMVYGPSVGEYSRDHLFGPRGNRLQAGDVAVSGDILARYFGWRPGQPVPVGRPIVINGRTYRVGDISYRRPGQPNTNTVEIWNGSPRTPDWGTVSGTDGGMTAPPRRSDPTEWTTSPNERRFLPESTPPLDINDSESYFNDDAAFFNFDDLEDVPGTAEEGLPPGTRATPSWDFPGTPPWDYGRGGMGINDGYMQNFVSNANPNLPAFSPWSDMGYGTRYNVSVGNEVVNSGIDPATGQPIPTGEIQIDPETGRPYDLNSIPESHGTGAPTGSNAGSPAIGTSTTHGANAGSPSNAMFGYGAVTGQRYYNVGGGWRPIGQAPQHIRSAQNSGTGNFNAEQFAKQAGANFYQGGPNDTGSTGDAGHTSFSMQGGYIGRLNEEGNIERYAARMNQEAFANRPQRGVGLYTTPESINAYNAWVMQQTPGPQHDIFQTWLMQQPEFLEQAEGIRGTQ